MGILESSPSGFVCVWGGQRFRAHLNGHEIIPMKLMTITINYVVKFNNLQMARAVPLLHGPSNLCHHPPPSLLLVMVFG